MRHRCGGRKLNITDGAHRRALMRHICCALIAREQINTTLPRAKELRRFIEPLITLGKVSGVHRRRLAFARLQNREAVAKLFDELGARFAARPGGYVRILKSGYRRGDNAPMALVEFVEKAPPREDNAAPAAKARGKTAAKGAKAKAAKSAKTAKSAKSAKAANAEIPAAAEQPDKAASDDGAADGDNARAAKQ